MCGASDGTRTRNLLITNQLLCQLSYTSLFHISIIVIEEILPIPPPQLVRYLNVLSQLRLRQYNTEALACQYKFHNFFIYFFQPVHILYNVNPEYRFYAFVIYYTPALICLSSSIRLTFYEFFQKSYSKHKIYCGIINAVNITINMKGANLL